MYVYINWLLLYSADMLFFLSKMHAREHQYLNS